MLNKETKLFTKLFLEELSKINLATDLNIKILRGEGKYNESKLAN